LADDDAHNRDRFIHMFRMMGIETVVAAENGSELLDRCLQQKPDIVITKITMPGMDGVEAARQIYEKWPVAIIFMANSNDATGHEGNNLWDQARCDHGLVYFTDVPSGLELQIAISASLASFDKLRQLEEKTRNLEQQLQEVQTSLENRKIIERAKGIIMKWAGIDEPQAYRRLRKLARDKNLKLVDMAATIVDLDDMPNVSRNSFQ
jgi:response regulator NasT